MEVLESARVAALVARLQEALDGAASVATRRWWEAYLKGAIAFRGVGIPRIRTEVAAWRVAHGIDAWRVADQLALALRLFEEPLAEDKLAGILFLQEFLVDRVSWRDAFARYETLYRRRLIADWNTCDWFCVRVLGPTVAAHGEPCAAALAAWSGSADLWQARSSVVGFVKGIAEREHHPLVLRSCAVLIQREERFAKTAVGWVLRDLGQHDAAAALAFVEAHLPHFSTESLRNALKHAPAATRERLLGELAAGRRAAASASKPNRAKRSRP